MGVKCSSYGIKDVNNLLLVSIAGYSTTSDLVCSTCLFADSRVFSVTRFASAKFCYTFANAAASTLLLGCFTLPLH